VKSVKRTTENSIDLAATIPVVRFTEALHKKSLITAAASTVHSIRVTPIARSVLINTVASAR
jgi:hypothetical protein